MSTAEVSRYSIGEATSTSCLSHCQSMNDLSATTGFFLRSRSHLSQTGIRTGMHTPTRSWVARR